MKPSAEELKQLKSVSPQAIRKVVEYLEDVLGLSVYGGNKDLDQKRRIIWEGPACRDYGAEDVILYRKMLMQGAERKEVDL